MRYRRGCGVGLLLLAALCGCRGGAEPPTPFALELAQQGKNGRAAGYNLLLITVDTLRADHLGCYGAPADTTPRIDDLARTGLRFTEATAAAPITLPAHASIMTGLNVPDHGVRHNGRFHLDAEHETLAERLQSGGYATAAFIGAYVLDGRYGLNQGFERYDDRVDEKEIPEDEGRYNERPADRVSDAALEWLAGRQQTDRPFFAWLHYFDPHGPYEPPEPFATRFAQHPYAGEIAFVDEQIGRVVDYLRERGWLERTLIVFTADHGEGLGQHDEISHADLIYESTMHVPLILSNETLFGQPVVVDDRVVGSVDILPTLLDLLGLPRQRLELDGINVLTTMPDSRRAIYIETMAPLLDYGWAALHGLRRVHDKVILAPTPEYYDLRSDPDEATNLFPGQPDAAQLKAELEKKLREWPPDQDVLGREAQIAAEEAERLASLGYVQLRDASQPLGVKDPKTMMPLRMEMNRAGQLSLHGEHQAAVEAIVAVLREDPNDAKAWYTAAGIYDRAQQFEEAEVSLRRAVMLSPRADGWVNLARYALNRGDEARFEFALAEAERMDPQNGGVYLGRGYWHAEAGRTEEAIRAFEKALEVDPVKSGPTAREELRKLRGEPAAGSP